MDKKKQIEEMAKIICKDGANNGDCDKCGFHRQCSKFKVAEKLYNASYRKIPEGVVVLTEEEREEFNELYRSALQRAEKWEKLCGIKIKETRKETAEKFAERLKESETIKEIAEDGYIVSYVELCNKIDEICKEITEGKV